MNFDHPVFLPVLRCIKFDNWSAGSELENLGSHTHTFQFLGLELREP